MTKCSTCKKEVKVRWACAECGERNCDEHTYRSYTGANVCKACMDKEIEGRSLESYKVGKVTTK
jgi:hypothetical protein